MNLQTPCKSCIFATWDGKTQIGCSIGRLEKLRAAGVEILECFDDEKEFFVVNKKFCLFCRAPEWGEKYKAYKDEWPKLVDLETMISYHSIILTDDNSTLLDIEKTCDEFGKQYMGSRNHTVIFKKGTLKAPKIGRLLDKYKIKWRLQETSEDVDDLSSIDACLDYIDNIPYYVVTKAGTPLKEGCIETLHRKTRDKYVQFGLIKNWGGFQQIVPTAIHKLYGGNAMDTLEYKLIADGFQDKIFEGDSFEKV